MPKPIKKQEQTTPELTPTPEPPQEAPPQAPEASITPPVEVKEPEPSLDALKAEIAALQAKLAAQPAPTAKIAPSLPSTTPDGKKIAWATGVPTVTKTAQP